MCVCVCVCVCVACVVWSLCLCERRAAVVVIFNVISIGVHVCWRVGWFVDYWLDLAFLIPFIFEIFISVFIGFMKGPRPNNATNTNAASHSFGGRGAGAGYGQQQQQQQPQQHYAPPYQQQQPQLQQQQNYRGPGQGQSYGQGPLQSHGYNNHPHAAAASQSSYGQSGHRQGPGQGHSASGVGAGLPSSAVWGSGGIINRSSPAVSVSITSTSPSQARNVSTGQQVGAGTGAWSRGQPPQQGDPRVAQAPPRPPQTQSKYVVVDPYESHRPEPHGVSVGANAGAGVGPSAHSPPVVQAQQPHQQSQPDHQKVAANKKTKKYSLADLLTKPATKQPPRQPPQQQVQQIPNRQQPQAIPAPSQMLYSFGPSSAGAGVGLGGVGGVSGVNAAVGVGVGAPGVGKAMYDPNTRSFVVNAKKKKKKLSTIKKRLLMERLRRLASATAQAMAAAADAKLQQVNALGAQTQTPQQVEQEAEWARVYADYSVLRINGFADLDQLEDEDERAEIINNIHSIFASTHAHTAAGENAIESIQIGHPNVEVHEEEDGEDNDVPIYVYFASFGVTRLSFELISDLVIAGTKIQAAMCNKHNVRDVLHLPASMLTHSNGDAASTLPTPTTAVSSVRTRTLVNDEYGVVMIKNLVHENDLEDEDELSELLQEDLKSLCASVGTPLAAWIVRTDPHPAAATNAHTKVTADSGDVTTKELLSPLDVVIEYSSLRAAVQALSSLHNVVIGGTPLTVSLYDYTAYTRNVFSPKHELRTESDIVYNSFTSVNAPTIGGGAFVVVIRNAIDRIDWLNNLSRNEIQLFVQSICSGVSNEPAQSAAQITAIESLSPHSHTVEDAEGVVDVDAMVDVAIQFDSIADALTAIEVWQCANSQNAPSFVNFTRASIDLLVASGGNNSVEAQKLSSSAGTAVIQAADCFLSTHTSVYTHQLSAGSTDGVCIIVHDYFTSEDELVCVYNSNAEAANASNVDIDDDVDNFIASKRDLLTLASKHIAKDTVDAGVLRVTPLALLTARTGVTNAQLLAGVVTDSYESARELMLRLEGSLIGGHRIEVTAHKGAFTPATASPASGTSGHGFNASYVNSLLIPSGADAALPAVHNNYAVIGGVKYVNVRLQSTLVSERTNNSDGGATGTTDGQDTDENDNGGKPKTKLELVKITPKQDKHAVGARPIPVSHYEILGAIALSLKLFCAS
jgi:hypothetical protein